MEKEPRQAAYRDLVCLAEEQGYITFDDIMNYADRYALPIQDFDWLSNSITTYGIIVYADAPSPVEVTNDEDYDDFAQSNYQAVFDRIVELNPSLEQLVNAVRNIIPPQRNEIQQLKYQIVEGNRFARIRMIEMHLRLALRLALQRAETYDMDIEDAISNACIGLVIAVDKYDPDTSGAFASYAALWILQNIMREQSTQRPLVYYPVHKKEDYFVMYPILKQHGCAGCNELLNCKKAEAMVMSRFECNRQKAHEILLMMMPDERIEDLINRNSDGEVSDDIDCRLAEISDDAKTDTDDAFAPLTHKILCEAVNEELKHLTEKEVYVIRERYGFNGREKTLEEVGQELCLTRERIRQIEAKALRKLRHTAASSHLKEFY